MPTTPTLTAKGLNLSPNQLTVEPGSLIEASNVIIRRDDVIEPRRGYKLYGQSFGSINDTLKQQFVYRERLLRHYNDILEFQNGLNNDGSVHFDEFDGSYLETETGLRIKSIEANGNFYFTTSEGIKKISAKFGTDLTSAPGFITQAGGIKAIDMDARIDFILGNQTGFMPQDSTVAYRHIWAYFDANNNLIRGTPSQRAEVYFSLETALIRDFNNLLLALDNIDQTGSLITDGNYVFTLGLDITDSASDVRTNAISLAAKLDNDIEITEGAVNTATAEVTSTTVLTLVFNTSVATYIQTGDQLALSGFTSGGLTQLNGRFFDVTNVTTTTVTATVVGAALSNQAPTADTGGVVKRNKYTLITQPVTIDTPPTNDQLVSLQDYISEIMIELQAEPTGIISAPLQSEFIIVLDVTTSTNTIVTVSIPEGITPDYFLQVFRSSISQATGVTVLSDLIANDEMQLVYETFPTATELAAGELSFTDLTPDAFRGANLYTNESTGEGAAQANDLPPFAKDINTFKNVTFYANTRTRHRKLLSILGVVNMLVDYNLGLNTKTFVSGDVDTSSDFIMITAHGFIEGQSIRFTNPTPSNLPGGIIQGQTYYILNADTNSFQITLDKDTTIPVDLTSGGTGTHTVLNILPSITIVSDGISQTYYFIKGVQEVTQVVTVADVAGSLDGTYWYINSANDVTQYYVYYQLIGASNSDPLIPGKTAIPVHYFTGSTATAIAEKTRDTLNSLFPNDFTATSTTNVLVITNTNFGYTTDATDQTSGFTIAEAVVGKGENASLNEILLSDNASPAIAVDETSRSLIRVLNANSNGIVYGYYLSTANTVPGRIFLEARVLSTIPFYIVGADETVGQSFSPNVTPENNALSISAANPTVITTKSAHGFTSGNTVIITNSNSTPSIDGSHQIIVLSATTFSIPVNVTVAGNFATISSSDFAEASENEEKANRIYFSKPNQPEAVPLVNFFDVGAQEQEIMRIFPLRDSLFTFKSDGLYRVSGEAAPFNLALFDGTCKLIAPDSLGAESNLIYGWEARGVVTVSESGVSEPISRPIDTAILRLATYPNFRTSTFGIGYQSDNSYLAWTVTNINDEIATICYRFSSLTGTWTTFDKTNTCGLINDNDGLMYLGAGDTNFTEQERKNFTRYDYADREISFELNDNYYFDDQLVFTNVEDFEEGDVLIQEQTLSVYGYNNLLRHLDNDPSITTSDYLSTLEAFGGNNLRNKLIDLTQKLDTDPGVADSDYEFTIENKTGSITAISVADPTIITSTSHELFTGRIINIAGSNSVPSVNGNYEVTVLDANRFTIDFNVTTAGTAGTWSTVNEDFQDLKASFNKVVVKLNLDTSLSFSNYELIVNDTVQEAVVLSVNRLAKKVKLNLTLDYIVGDMLLFKAIDSDIMYCPNSVGDPMGFKQFRQSTLMFENKAFTNAVMRFSSDLLPAFNNVPFNGDGNGIFGHNNFGEGFFGGGSHAAPFRTYIPRNVQRCRFLTVAFQHKIAREFYAIYGLSLSYETYAMPERAYK